jgi:fucose 4-O-acetylase-like acetyltransferase
MVETSRHDVSVGVAQRELWVDNVRVLLIAGVIVVHTATAYVLDIAGWYYEDERSTSGVWSSVLIVPAAFGALFALGPLFFVAGWFSVRSIARRGPAGFARARLVRLGVPILVFVALVEPLTDYLGNIWDESHGFGYYMGTTELSVMWFAAALLVFSLVYAAWEHVRPTAARPGRLRPAALVVAIVTIAVSSFLVWLVWPLDGEMFLNLRVPEWPQGAVLFALGVHAGRAGWLDDLPRGLVRRLGWMTVAGMIVLLSLLAVAFAPGEEELSTRADWPTLLFALCDGVIAVAMTIWLVASIRRRWPAHGPLLGKAGRASYATYFLHPLLLTALMLLFSSVPLEPGIKFALVATVAIPVCFTVGYALTRLPGISKVL